MARREELIQEILDRELEMFLSVRAREPVSCQQDPEGFRLHRGAQFSVWSEATLGAYRNDLERAAGQGQNLMTLKYARMENLIPKLHEDILVANLIDQIVAIEVEWQREMMRKYPYLTQLGRPLDEQDEASVTTSFVKYLRGELETYSEETLAHLYKDVSESRGRNENQAEQVYVHMVKSHGYASIEEAEAAAEMQVKGNSSV
jgi:hypothetical protein